MALINLSTVGERDRLFVVRSVLRWSSHGSSSSPPVSNFRAFKDSIPDLRFRSWTLRYNIAYNACRWTDIEGMYIQWVTTDLHWRSQTRVTSREISHDGSRMHPYTQLQETGRLERVHDVLPGSASGGGVYRLMQSLAVNR